MADRYFHSELPNGLILLAEQMPGMQSAAMTLLVPAGSSTDPADRSGAATVLAELVLRGAGNRDNRQLTDYLDSLGLQRGSGVGRASHAPRAAPPSRRRSSESLATYADIVRRPMLPESGFAPSRDLALQALAGIDDEPRQKLMIKLREWHLPCPFGRNSMGEKEHLERLTLDFCPRRLHARDTTPAARSWRWRATSISKKVQSAGRAILRRLERPAHSTPLELQPAASADTASSSRRASRRTSASRTTSIPETHEDYYVARMAIEVLSGGMSGRLFTEIREKRGLCYSVGVSYASLKDLGSDLRLRRHEQRPRPGHARLLHRRAAPVERRRHSRTSSTAPRSA